MADVVEQGEGRGLSRRQMIKASAVAGAAAWTAPVIIDSLASPASALSAGGSYACSKGYVIYKVGTTVYYSGFQVGFSTCNHCGTGNIQDDVSGCLTCPTGVFYGGSVRGGGGPTAGAPFFFLRGPAGGAPGAAPRANPAGPDPTPRPPPAA